MYNGIFDYLRSVVYNLYESIFSNGSAMVLLLLLLPIEIRVTDTLRASGDAQTHTFTSFFVASVSLATASFFAGYFLVRFLYLLSLLFFLRNCSRFDLVWFRLSCDHGWIRSGSVNVR